MTKTVMLFISAIMVLGILALAYNEADAASRFGGGRSFGGKSSFSKPFSGSAPSMTAPKAGAPAAAATAGATGMNRGGLFGGMGGMLGGLLAGSLIGSLLFGGGFGGGGFMDIILIGLVIFLAFKFFARRKTAANAANGPQMATAGAAQYADQNDAWSKLRNTPPSQTANYSSGSPGSSNTINAATPSTGTTEDHIPANFDREEFLTGAKTVYARLNSSWDKRDLNDISQFTTPSLLNEITQQAQDDPTPSQTEIMLVKASLIDVVTENNEETASVYFDVLMREEQAEAVPHDVREVWHFTRPSSGGSWKLDGIQQVEK